MNNLKKFIDYSFYLRGFLAFIIVPIILLTNISPFDDFLLHSNVYLNAHRYPNLNEPAYYCILYFFSTFIFLQSYCYFSKKIDLQINHSFVDNIKNIKTFYIYIFLIILVLKLRVLYNIEYLDKFKISGHLDTEGNLLIDNVYIYLLIHFFLPNELVFILISFYNEKIIKSRLTNSFFITYITLTLLSTILFGSRLLLVLSSIMAIFLLFKFKHKLKNFIIIPLFLVFIIVLLYFIPFQVLIFSDNLNNLLEIFDHFVWRLDVFHLVDLGFSSGNINVYDTNAYGRSVGIITQGDKNTGIEFPFFYYFIKIDNSILINTIIVILCSFFIVIFYEIIKLASISFGKLFFIVFLFKFCATWPEIAIDGILSVSLKLIFIFFVVYIYLFIEKTYKSLF